MTTTFVHIPPVPNVKPALTVVALVVVETVAVVVEIIVVATFNYIYAFKIT